MKKIFNFALALTAVLAFTACGSDDDGNVIITPARPLSPDVIAEENVLGIEAATAEEVGTTSSESVRFSRFEVTPDGHATITYELIPFDITARATRDAIPVKKLTEVVDVTCTPENNKRIYGVSGSRYIRKVTLTEPVVRASGPVITIALVGGGSDVSTSVTVQQFDVTQVRDLFRTWNVTGVRVKLFGKGNHDNYFKYYNGCDFPAIRADLEAHDASIGDLDGFDKNLKSISISPFGSFTLYYADNSTDGCMITFNQALSWTADWYNSADVNKYLRDAIFTATFNAIGFQSVVHQLCIIGTATIEESNYGSVNVEFYLDD